MTPILISLMTWVWGIVLAIMIRRHPEDSWLEMAIKGVTLAPLTGPGLLSVSWFFAVYLGKASLTLFVLVGISTILAIVARRQRPRIGLHCPLGDSKWLLLPMIAGVFLTAVSLYLDQRHGRGGADAMAIWNYAARFLHRAQGDYSALMPSLDPSHHMDYPLFFPAAIAGQWYFAGEESWTIVQWTHVGFILPMGTLSFEILRASRSALVAALGATALQMTPALLIWSQRQYVDGHLAYAVLGATFALSSLTDCKRPSQFSPLTTGLFLGSLPWIKNEGIPLLLLLLALFVWHHWRRKPMRIQRRTIIAMLVGASFFLMAHLAFKQNWSIANDLILRGRESLVEYLSSWHRWRTVLLAYAGEFNPLIALSRQRWAGSLLATVLLFLVGAFRGGWRQDPTLCFLMRFMLLACCGWLLVYAITPQELNWHLTTSMNRLVLQISPTFLVTSVLFATRARLAKHPQT